jgi:hypothetical protein
VRILLAFALFLSGCAVVVSGGTTICESPQTASLTLDSTNSVVLLGRSCPSADDKHYVSLELLVEGEVVQKEHMNAEGFAYVISIDHSVDIDNDGIRDIGIANGAGRAGDGMTYWLLKHRPFRLLSAGEASRLSLSTDGKSVLYSLVTGSGDIQATRLEYQIMEGQLRQNRALQFVPLNDVSFEIRELIRSDSAAQSWQPRGVKRASSDEAQRCMDGGRCP